MVVGRGRVRAVGEERGGRRGELHMKDLVVRWPSNSSFATALTDTVCYFEFAAIKVVQNSALATGDLVVRTSTRYGRIELPQSD